MHTFDKNRYFIPSPGSVNPRDVTCSPGPVGPGRSSGAARPDPTSQPSRRSGSVGRRGRALATVLLGAATLAAGPASAQRHDAPETRPPLSVEMGAYAFAPAPLRTTVRIEPHADNRLLRVVIDSPAFYRSSEVQIDGLAEARTHRLEWKLLPAGDYCVQMTLVRSGHRPIAVTRPYRVIGNALEMDQIGRAMPSCSGPATGIPAARIEASSEQTVAWPRPGANASRGSRRTTTLTR